MPILYRFLKTQPVGHSTVLPYISMADSIASLVQAMMFFSLYANKVYEKSKSCWHW